MRAASRDGATMPTSPMATCEIAEYYARDD